ncbi:MAG: hypothetical protein ACLU9S_13800 [Oscillospiraceae bacterium]
MPSTKYDDVARIVKESGIVDLIWIFWQHELIMPAAGRSSAVPRRITAQELSPWLYHCCRRKGRRRQDRRPAA